MKEAETGYGEMGKHGDVNKCREGTRTVVGGPEVLSCKRPGLESRPGAEPEECGTPRLTPGREEAARGSTVVPTPRPPPILSFPRWEPGCGGGSACFPLLARRGNCRSAAARSSKLHPKCPSGVQVRKDRCVPPLKEPRPRKEKEPLCVLKHVSGLESAPPTAARGARRPRRAPPCVHPRASQKLVRLSPRRTPQLSPSQRRWSPENLSPGVYRELPATGRNHIKQTDSVSGMEIRHFPLWVLDVILMHKITQTDDVETETSLSGPRGPKGDWCKEEGLDKGEKRDTATGCAHIAYFHEDGNIANKHDSPLTGQ